VSPSARSQLGEPAEEKGRHEVAQPADAVLRSPDDACGSTRLDCTACGLHECPGSTSDPGGVITGWRFAATSFGVFAVPLLLALGGAVWFRGDQDQQLAGGFAGLCLGMTIAALASRLLHRESEVRE
jgi:hypothetical protein